MRAFITFTKKEITEHIRSGKLVFLTVLFMLFGVMNPAVAKLTPWLMELFAETLEGSGMIITEVTVTALDSWVQFFKNIPIALIVFVLIEGSVFTKEYRSGTLILSLTRGLSRVKVLFSKALVMLLLWTLEYWFTFAVTYGYNAYFWDNSIAKNLLFSVFAYWLFGIFVISLAVFFSAITSSNTGVFLGTGGVALALSVVGLIPKINKYLPTALTDGNSLIYGATDAQSYIVAILVTVSVSLACIIASIPLFNKKSL